MLSLVRALLLVRLRCWRLFIQLVAHRLLCEESKLEYAVEHDQQPSVDKPRLPEKRAIWRGIG